MQVTAQNETERRIVAIMQEMSSLLIMKNRDYGDASLRQGIVGNVVHLDDKISRYKNLVWQQIAKGKKPYNEGISDTLRDIIGYGVLGLIILERTVGSGKDFLGLETRRKG